MPGAGATTESTAETRREKAETRRSLRVETPPAVMPGAGATTESTAETRREKAETRRSLRVETPPAVMPGAGATTESTAETQREKAETRRSLRVETPPAVMPGAGATTESTAEAQGEKAETRRSLRVETPPAVMPGAGATTESTAETQRESRDATKPPGGNAAGGDAGRGRQNGIDRRDAGRESRDATKPPGGNAAGGDAGRGRHNGIDRRDAGRESRDATKPPGGNAAGGDAGRRGASKPRSLAASAVISALFCLLLAAPATAQQRAHLAGLITDASEAGVPQALLTAVNEDTGFRRTAESQTDGRFLIASVEPGTYKVSVRREGFRTMVRFGVRVAAGQTARVNFALSVGSMQETITVEGNAMPLERENATLGLQLPREQMENLPLNGRGVLSLLELAPGTVATPATRGEAGQFTVNGQRPNTHYFTVDGVSANTGVSGGGLPAQSTGGSLPGMSAFGSLHALISLEALREFRVETSSAMTEFGRLPGANVSLSSRSGTNELHGTVLYRLRHETLDANDWFANRYGAGRAPLRLHNFSAAAGGPVRRERTFFFLSYEHLTLRQPFAWRTPVPSLEARESADEWLRPVLNLFPEPNGANLGRDLAEWSGRNHRPSRLDAGGLRLDHAITPRVTAFARYHESPSLNEFGSTQINRLELRARSLTAGVNARPAAGVTLEGRVNRSGARAASLWSQSGPGCELELLTAFYLRRDTSCDYLVRLNIAGVGELVSGREGVRKQTQYQAAGGATIERGDHALRVGADYRRLAPSRHEATGTLSVIADSISDLEENRNPWVAHAEARYGSSVLKELSLLAQDTWRVTPRFTAVYGMRWEFTPAPVPDRPVYYLDAEKGYVMPERQPVWPRSYRNFAPRLGLAWAPGKTARTVLRAGGGIYYDSSVSIATDVVNSGPLNVSQFSSSRHAPFSMLLSYGFMPNLRLPVVGQWNASAERALGERDVVSAAYAGSLGRRLIRREMGGPGSTETVWLALATNNGRSDYHGLQFQYRRRMSRGLQAVASYTWSHSIDNSSTDALVHWAGGEQAAARDRGSSDFDVRHALAAAFTYERGGWGVDGMLHARTGFPITVLRAEHYTGVAFANAFRPDLVGGQPVWLNDGTAPGGRRLNPAAFSTARDGVQGTLGRNSITGFGMSQVDLAARREFPLGERRAVEARVEAFNLLNQANFGDPARYLISPLFGQSTSMLNLMLGTGSPASGLAPMFQIGGARSVQVGLRFRF